MHILYIRILKLHKVANERCYHQISHARRSYSCAVFCIHYIFWTRLYLALSKEMYWPLLAPLWFLQSPERHLNNGKFKFYVHTAWWYILTYSDVGNRWYVFAYLHIIWNYLFKREYAICIDKILILLAHITQEHWSCGINSYVLWLYLWMYHVHRGRAIIFEVLFCIGFHMYPPASYIVSVLHDKLKYLINYNSYMYYSLLSVNV